MFFFLSWLNSAFQFIINFVFYTLILPQWAWTILARCGATSISTGFIYNISLHNLKALTRPYVKWRDVFQGNYDVRARIVHGQSTRILPSKIRALSREYVCILQTSYDGYRSWVSAWKCCCVWWGINQAHNSIWKLKLQGIDWWSFGPISIICFLHHVSITIV